MRVVIVFAVLVVACGARTGLRTGTSEPSDSGAIDDAQTFTCASVAQITQTGFKPDAIAIDGDFVYWHDAQGVSRVHKSGGVAQAIATSTSPIWPDLSPFAVGGGQLFFADAQYDVMHVPVTGGTPEPVGLAAVNAAFAASTKHAYFWQRTNGPSQITRVDFSGQSFDAYAIVPEPPSKLLFDGDSQAIAAADPGVFDVYSGGYDLLSGMTSTDVAFDSTHVYFTSNDATNGARVLTLDLQSLATTPIADTAGAFAIEIDATALYFTDRNGLRVRRIANKTGPVTDVALSAPGFDPVDLALDGACVYWTSSAQNANASGAIMVAAKP